MRFSVFRTGAAALLMVVAHLAFAAAPIELYAPNQRTATFAACSDQFPNSVPFDVSRIAPEWKPRALCSDAFASVYSEKSKTPLLVFERLNRERLADAADETRTDEFFADPRVPTKGSATLKDYKGQSPAVDRGHLAPAADAPTATAMAQSFALSNIVPQDPTHNRKVWSKVESDVRKYVRRVPDDVYVVTGPLFSASPRTVGPNQVWVPDRLFKLVYHPSTGKAWAYVHQNGQTRGSAPVSYQAFVAETGLDLLQSPGLAY